MRIGQALETRGVEYLLVCILCLNTGFRVLRFVLGDIGFGIQGFGDLGYKSGCSPVPEK